MEWWTFNINPVFSYFSHENSLFATVLAEAHIKKIDAVSYSFW
jgi:hypothetical protein